jgi:S-adenosyl-L-methionine hydrolase (adenosine-forming)
LPAIVTLTTDFGLRDPYVAVMKAVILGIARDAHIVDITHDVAPHDIAEGALALEVAAPQFPSGTVHVAVVDPGVGTARRGLAVSWRGSVFVGPDNGVFTPFLREGRVFEVAAAEFRRFPVSPTFHGRDVFAPAAAHVARGIEVQRLGHAVADPVRLEWPDARESGGRVVGAVIHVDRFGNLITSIRAAMVEALGSDLLIEASDRVFSLVGTYGDLPEGEAGALIGSGGRLEIAVRGGRADLLLRASRGAPVLVSRSRGSALTSS